MRPRLLLLALPFLLGCGGGTSNPPAGRTPAPITLTVSPASVSLRPGQAQAFLAAVGGTSQGAVTWSVQPTTLGTIGSDGLFTASSAAGSGTVRATSVADPAVSAQAAVTVAAIAPAQVRILFLHHSTGGNVWNGGLEAWFQGYNQAHGTDYRIRERAYPDSPYPWANYPYDYWNLWVHHTGDDLAQGQDTLERLVAGADLVVFKHCFPVSDVVADSGRPDPASAVQSQENYRAQYAALKAKLRQFPSKTFVVWTGAALVQAATTAPKAQRARDFFAWVKSTWDEPGDNIFLWDFHELQTEGALYFKDGYAAGGGDSHPNPAFCTRVAPFLGRRLVNVIEGRGDSSRIDGAD